MVFIISESKFSVMGSWQKASSFSVKENTLSLSQGKGVLIVSAVAFRVLLFF